MEIRLKMEDAFVENLQKILALKPTELTRSAFTLLKWAADETLNGRIIASMEPNGEKIVRLAMPALDIVKRT